MKQLTFLLLLIFFVSCKSTSNIVTSKSEAQKMGIYTAPANKRLAVRTTTTQGNSTAARPKPIETKKIESRKKVQDRNEDDYVVNSENSSYLVRQLINMASENLGAGYRTGGTDSNTGFDCSGLMFSTFKKFDITLPRSSNDMSKIGTKLDNSDIKKGDLIFFKTNGRRVINHVGMVTEVSDNEIKFIHSSTQKGVIISSTKEPYYGRTFAQANRILLQ